MDELLAILPQVRALIEEGGLENLPAIHDPLRAELVPLRDCAHKVFRERNERVRGPCARNENHVDAFSFTRCAGCKLIL